MFEQPLRATRLPVKAAAALMTAEGGPRLLAIDDIIVAIADGRRLDVCEIRASPRFRIALTPPILATQHAAEPMPFLVLAPKFDQHQRQHAEPKGYD